MMNGVVGELDMIEELRLRHTAGLPPERDPG